MKKITPLTGLEFDGHCNLASTITGSGTTHHCSNLAESSSGALEGFRMPARVALLDAKPVACDRRDSLTYIFTQQDDGTIILAGTLDDADNYRELGVELARVQTPVRGSAAVGEFLVMRDAGGELHYLRWQGEGYEWMGELPQAPVFEAVAEDEISFSGEIPAVSFKTVQTDLRSGLAPENVRQIAEAMKQGMKAAVEGARNAGMRVMPAMVRVAWRLWDGRLLHLSEAQRVSGTGALPGTERVTLGLESSAKGFTGTRAGSVEVCAWRLRVKQMTPIPAAWAQVVSGAEIWVSEPQPYLSDEQEPTAVSGTSTERISCSYGELKPQQVQKRLMQSGMSLQWSGTPQQSVSVGVDLKAEVSTQITCSSAPLSAERQQADALLGYGGFLHLGLGSGVWTSVRGNPFVQGGGTADTGGAVKHMWPQLSGGGAYTRQYIYLATSHGIVALTHDSEGGHRTCRFIAPQLVDDARKGVATMQGLFVAGTGGEVLRLKDARAEVIMRCVEGIESLAWNERKAWLLLCGATQTLVLQERFGWRGFTTSFVCEALADVHWRRLCIFGWRLGQTALYDMDALQPSNATSDCLYRGLIPDMPPGLVARLHVGVTGAPIMAQAGVLVGLGSDMKEVVRANLSGSSAGGVVIAMAGVRAAAGRLQHTEFFIGGSMGSFAGCRWLPLR